MRSSGIARGDTRRNDVRNRRMGEDTELDAPERRISENRRDNMRRALMALLCIALVFATAAMAEM